LLVNIVENFAVATYMANEDEYNYMCIQRNIVNWCIEHFKSKLRGHFLFTPSDTFAARCIVQPKHTA